MLDCLIDQLDESGSIRGQEKPQTIRLQIGGHGAEIWNPQNRDFGVLRYLPIDFCQNIKGSILGLKAIFRPLEDNCFEYITFFSWGYT